MQQDDGWITGRIATGPHDLLRTEILEPQLRYELRTLLPWYVRIERVLLVEYHRMGVLDAAEVTALDRQLDRVTPESVGAVAGESMTDVAFAVERFVTRGLAVVPPAWHVDRSRNDLQAGAQLLDARRRILDVAGLLLTLGRTAGRVAGETVELVMPGYTHMQAAQVISPGFYLSAVVAQVLHSLERLDAVCRTAGASPLGAGAMAGQELPWDRARMARLLGFDEPGPHALRAVAQRDWALEATTELAMLGVAVSRFTTDLMFWAGAGTGFVDLPDDWSGISSAMPQKKNFPILERIRGRCARLAAAHMSVLMAQRNTPYSNSVEVSKEAGADVPAAFDAAESVLRLFTAVLEVLRFRADRMRGACRADYLGGFTLANLLTLRAQVPWRTAQVVAGRYIVAATDRGLAPHEPDPALLVRVAAEQGHPLAGALELLTEAFDVDAALAAKRTRGSTDPSRVRELLRDQEAQLGALAVRFADRAQHTERGAAELTADLARIAGVAGSAVPSGGGRADRR